MTSRSPLGALISTLGRLQPPDFELAQQIARLLGLSLLAPAASSEAPARSQVTVEPTMIDPVVAPLPDVTRARITTTESGPNEQTGRGGLGARRLVLRNVTSTPPTARGRTTLPADTQTLASPPFEPLLRTVAARAVVSAALARRTATGGLDAARLVDLVASRKPIRELPRLLASGVAPSTRVMIDCGPGMAPFARDAIELGQNISAVASRDRTEVLRFWQSPLCVGTSARSAVAHELPPPATAVVAISDLGISGAGIGLPDLEQQWLDFRGQLTEAKCSLVVFVPYPDARWPPVLAESLPLVCWDRSTTLADVRVASAPRARA